MRNVKYEVPYYQQQAGKQQQQLMDLEKRQADLLRQAASSAASFRQVHPPLECRLLLANCCVCKAFACWTYLGRSYFLDLTEVFTVIMQYIAVVPLAPGLTIGKVRAASKHCASKPVIAMLLLLLVFQTHFLQALQSPHKLGSFQHDGIGLLLSTCMTIPAT